MQVEVKGAYMFDCYFVRIYKVIAKLVWCVCETLRKTKARLNMLAVIILLGSD